MTGGNFGIVDSVPAFTGLTVPAFSGIADGLILKIQWAVRAVAHFQSVLKPMPNNHKGPAVTKSRQLIAAAWITSQTICGQGVAIRPRRQSYPLFLSPLQNLTSS